MCAQNANITFGGRNRIRAGNRNDPRPMRDLNRGFVNPVAAAADHGVTNSIHAHGSVVVPAYRKDGCVGPKNTYQVA